MIGEALRLIRLFHDVKQSDAADMLGISKSYLSEIESGTKQPSLALIERYSKLFDVPPSSILFFSENLKGRGRYEKARRAVVPKVLALLKFIEARAKKSKDG